jgi:UDP:flavonoid glycosyltransferase YjiC (YdhE family)
MKRIVFVAPPFAGHLNPLLPLAAAARDAGYEVTVITGERKLPAVRGLGLRAYALRSIGADSLESIANSPVRVGSNPIRLLAQFRQNLALLPAIREELLDLWRQEKPDLVVADSVAPVAGIACDALGIPWITTIATPFAIENRHGVPAYCGGWQPGLPLRDALGRLTIRSFKRAVAWHFRSEFAAFGDAFPYREDGSERIYSPRAILGFGLTELEFPRDWPACFQMIGPVIESPEEGPALSFPEGKKRVLVTVGTHLLWAKRTLTGSVVKLSAEFPNVHFSVSMGGGAGVPVRVSETVTVYPFIRYAQDLGAFDAVIHHGGAGITYAAILYGVPSVVVPHDYDQFDYAARVEHFGLGLRARSIANAGPALRRVLAQGWPALKGLSVTARTYRPVDRFLAVAREIAG